MSEQPIHEDSAISTTEALREAIARVSFERSCLDMGWQWEIARGEKTEGSDPDMAGICTEGWLIRCSFQRPDRDTGAVSRAWGRWWWIDDGTTASAVQKTMFAAARLIADHELLEAFKVDGRRPFDPHRTVGDLTSGATR